MTKPFIKWVGGKTQLLSELSSLLSDKCSTYYEPFLGGGALFFHFAEQNRFQRAVLNDLNFELINCYEMVRDHLENLMKELDAFQLHDDWNTREFFNQVRASEPMDPIDRAARFIYLNKLCFNGMHRVNKKGKFNVPFGKYKNPKLYDRPVIESCSKALQKATLKSSSFEDTVTHAQPGDLVYFDPPYIPVSATSNFTAYAGDFGHKEQKHLANVFSDLYNRGVMVALSNSNAPLVHELYSGFNVHIVGAKRSINSKGDGRGKINEVIVIGQK